MCSRIHATYTPSPNLFIVFFFFLWQLILLILFCSQVWRWMHFLHLSVIWRWPLIWYSGEIQEYVPLCLFLVLPLLRGKNVATVTYIASSVLKSSSKGCQRPEFTRGITACGVTRAQSNKTEQAEVTPSPAGEVVSLTDFPVFNSLAK